MGGGKGGNGDSQKAHQKNMQKKGRGLHNNSANSGPTRKYPKKIPYVGVITSIIRL